MSEPLKDFELPKNPVSKHNCPVCKSEGRTFRSLPRNWFENLSMKLVPMYGIYRCHDCNRRSWRVRGPYSRWGARILLLPYIAILGAALYGIWLLIAMMFAPPPRLP